jgi:hypothetical protein
MPDEIDWNECVPWDGEEKNLPAGEQTRIPNFRAVDLVRAWEILDVQSEAGFKIVPAEKGKMPEGIIIGAQINENAVNAVIKAYGKRFIVFRPSEDQPFMDRWEWYAAFAGPDGIGPDVLELEALKQIRQVKVLDIHDRRTLSCYPF